MPLIEEDIEQKEEEDRIALSFGALLHDVGKILYRGSSAAGTHSKLGYDFIMQDMAVHNEAFSTTVGKRIAEQIRFHHARELKNASELANDSLAYITYFADNISAAMDRKLDENIDQRVTFNRDARLEKVFNILNGHADKNELDHEDYNRIRERLIKGLAGIQLQYSELNSLVNLLEATTSRITSSTNMAELRDISLYDHTKTTAAIASCIYEYLHEKQITDYRGALFSERESDAMYSEPMFLLYSCDMSGIQSFIYNISGAGALKQLRARSFYLEILLEDIVDELLERLKLFRSNLLYSGGGHAYLLLPNTEKCKEELENFSTELRNWFLRHYRTDLYLAGAYVVCSGEDLMNKGEDKKRYGSLYREVSKKLSHKKATRYSASEISLLNFGQDKKTEHERECSECHRSDTEINKDGLCPVCASLRTISADLVHKSVFAVLAQEGQSISNSTTKGLILPFGKTLQVYSREGYLKERPQAVRVYTKNDWDMGISLSTHVWMGDYEAETRGDRFEEYSKYGISLNPERGVKRLGVLRADVDDLGAALSGGFPEDKMSLSRTATFSRALSFFFKYKINTILESKGYQAQIIYAGGDDMFIVGNWSDIIFAAIDIRDSLIEFTGNDSLTISAGIGIFDSTYPIARMAEETGVLEDAAKLYKDKVGKTKNAIALWDRNFVFSWDEFVGRIVPRLTEIEQLFDVNEKGKAFIYKLVYLLRNYDDVSSAPRLAYLLARSFEDVQSDSAAACRMFYSWAADERERMYLIVALEWYVYSIRERG